MRVLVTGGAGFVGSHYVRTLLAGGYPGFEDAGVTVLDKLTYAGNRTNLAAVDGDPRLRFVEGDICSPADLDAAMPGHEYVVNAAAESHVDRSLRRPADFVLTNAVGAQQVFEAAVRHGVRRVVQVSTDEVYGSISTGSWTEDQVLEPTSPYAASKAAGDVLARSYARSYGLSVSVTRASNTYGPFHFPEKLVPLALTRLLDGGTVPLYGDGRHVREWLHVDDHCRGIQVVLERGSPGEAYNIGGGAELTNRRLVDLLLAATGRDGASVELVDDPRGAAHDLRYSVDWSKAAALGYRPRVPFAAGLADTVRWFREHRSWWEPLLTRQF
jgi:dTDP-glucose 4,6-dehydratase